MIKKIGSLIIRRGFLAAFAFGLFFFGARPDAAAQADASSQDKDEKYLQYQEKLTKLNAAVAAKIKAAMDEAKRKAAGVNGDIDKLSAAEIASWLRDHGDEEKQMLDIFREANDRRRAIFVDYDAERKRLEGVYRAGNKGKVGYIFIGDVEYNSSRRKMEAWFAGLRNLATLGWLTGNEPNRLNDYEPLIRDREKLLRQKFETVITIYLAKTSDLEKALSDPQTGGYVWFSHGATENGAIFDDDGNLWNADHFKNVLDAARKRYIKSVLPENLRKLREDLDSLNPDVKEVAQEKIADLAGEDRRIYDCVLAEAKKVSLGLDYVEHYACHSASDKGQELADMLVGDKGTFVGYTAYLFPSGAINYIQQWTSWGSPTEFKGTGKKPDPKGSDCLKKPDQPPAGGVVSTKQNQTGRYCTNNPNIKTEFPTPPWLKRGDPDHPTSRDYKDMVLKLIDALKEQGMDGPRLEEFMNLMTNRIWTDFPEEIAKRAQWEGRPAGLPDLKDKQAVDEWREKMAASFLAEYQRILASGNRDVFMAKMLKLGQKIKDFDPRAAELANRLAAESVSKQP